MYHITVNYRVSEPVGAIRQVSIFWFPSVSPCRVLFVADVPGSVDLPLAAPLHIAPTYVSRQRVHYVDRSGQVSQGC